jgi:hypothetical protein
MKTKERFYEPEQAVSTPAHLYKVQIEFPAACDEIYQDANDMLGFLFNFTQDFLTCAKIESYKSKENGNISIVPLMNESSERPTVFLSILLANVQSKEFIENILDTYRENFGAQLRIHSIEVLSDCSKILDDLRLDRSVGELDVFEAGIAVTYRD